MSNSKDRRGVNKPDFSFASSATAAIFSAVLEQRARILFFTSTCPNRIFPPNSVLWSEKDIYILYITIIEIFDPFESFEVKFQSSGLGILNGY